MNVIKLSKVQKEKLAMSSGWLQVEAGLKDKFLSYLLGLGLAGVIGTIGYQSYGDYSTLQKHKNPFEQSIVDNSGFLSRAKQAKKHYDANNGNMDEFVLLSRDIAENYMRKNNIEDSSLQQALTGEAVRFFEREIKK